MGRVINLTNLRRRVKGMRLIDREGRWRIRPAAGRGAEELEIERKVAAVQGAVQSVNGDDVGAFHQKGGRVVIMISSHAAS